MSSVAYLEARSQIKNTAADIAKHWQARQPLGKALIICQDAQSTQQQVRKHWQHLCQSLQKERDNTMASDQLLRLTHRIVRMQEAFVTTELPQALPTASVFCVTPAQIMQVLPGEYFSVYVTTSMSREQSIQLLALLPAQALITCYSVPNGVLQQCQPKAILDQALTRTWEQMNEFMQTLGIDIAQLSQPSQTRPKYIDECLDELLASPKVTDFLQLASQFKAVRLLAEPSQDTNAQNRQYDTLIVLARHVQALTPGIFGEPFRAGIDDPMFFLNDSARKMLIEQIGSANTPTFPTIITHAIAQYNSSLAHRAQPVHYLSR